jgi:hypothetical protein
VKDPSSTTRSDPPYPSQDIEVPETLLKKRKQNEKAREERLVAAAAARKVCPRFHEDFSFLSFHDVYLSTMASGLLYAAALN